MNRRRWLVPGAIALGLLVLGLTARWWLPPLLGFVGANTDLIQGVADLTQIVLWGCAGLSLLVGIWRGRSGRGPEQKAETARSLELSQQVEAENAIVATGGGAAAEQVAVGRDVHGDVIVVADPDHLWRAIRRRPPAQDLRQATERYLEHLVDRYRYLDFKGMGASERVPLRLPLVEMYVPLRARVELPEGETWARQLRLAGRKLSAEEQEVTGERLSEPRPVLDLLRENDGLVILGDPGAGKTTFLKYLALRLAAGQAAEVGVEARLPVLVPLSAYANALASADVRLDDFVARYFHDLGTDLPIGAMLDEALRQGGALVLLDGLDEVKELGLRQDVVRRVIDFYSFHRGAGNRFVLTSRVVGYRQVRQACEGLIECTLVDFDDAEIEEFVQKWTAALEKAARGDTPEAALEADRERRDFLDAVQRNPGVRGLATNPLLLTILALMKRQGVVLPDRRAELYDQYVRTLLSSWNRARGLGRAPTRDLDVVETMRILAPLALWMHEVSPGVGLVKQGDVQRKLEEIYEERGAADPERAALQFLSDVREHAGLLLERGAGSYGFIHLTFEEYLAAVGIARLGQREREPAIKVLTEHVGEPAWREVTSLTIGYLGIVQQWDEVASDVAAGILACCPGEPGQAAVWVGDAVADAWPGGVTLQCRREVVSALVEAVGDDTRVAPAVRAAAGNALARLGDPRHGLGLRPDGLPDLAWCEVPAGAFGMGSGENDRYAQSREKPRHLVELPLFRITRYPITNAQYQAFVDDGGYSEDRWQACWTDAGRRWKGDRTGPDRYGGVYDLSNHPVVMVCWYEALAYCHWLTLRLRESGEIEVGEEVRLPGEAEWEKAARGTDGRIYPWGERIDANRANYAETGIDATSAVGCFPGGQSPYGCQEMSGNVWEWCATKWEEGYQAYKGDDDPRGESARVWRGGAFYFDPRLVRCAFRLWDFPDFRGRDLGFRVVLASPG